MREHGFSFGLPFLLETPGVQEAVDLCVREGLQFVELNSNFPSCSLEVLRGLPLKKMAQEQGIFFTLHVDDRFDPFDINPYVRAAYVRTMLEAIDIARDAGMPVINMHIPKGNIVNLPGGKHFIYQEYPEVFRENLLAFREAVYEAVAGSELRIAIENTVLWEHYEQAAIQLLLQSPAFSLCLDTGHDHATRNQDLAFIRQHQDRLSHMHLHDGWDQINHQALGTGVIPIQERLKMAKEARATVVVETKTIESLHQSVQYLKAQGWLPQTGSSRGEAPRLPVHVN